MPHVIVIGAGPAGSLCALLLARAGVHVTIVEQHTFPRDKVCGECISALGIAVLRRAGAHDALQSLHPRVLTHCRIHTVAGDEIDLRLPEPMWGLTRLAMDPALLNVAREAGAMIRQPARCEQLEIGPQPRLLLRDLHTNEKAFLEADWIILADGKAALLPTSPISTGDFGIKTHFTHVNGPTDAIELFGVNGHYGGLAAVENDRWNLAFSVPAERLRMFKGNLDAVLAAMMDENRSLKNRLSNARRASAWMSSPLPRFAVSSEPMARVIPIGNAAAALEPVGGEGMGLALRSAELAAHALLDAIKSGRDESVKKLPAAYRQLWSVRRAGCRTLAMIVSRPWLAEAAMPLAASNDALVSAALFAIGKGHSTLQKAARL